jgi:hypothetical protein
MRSQIEMPFVTFASERSQQVTNRKSAVTLFVTSVFPCSFYLSSSLGHKSQIKEGVVEMVR